MRRVLGHVPLALVVLMALLTACQDDSWVLREYSAGWAAPRADARNSGYADQDVPQDLVTKWSRPLLGSTYSQPSISSRGFVGVTALTEHGCNTFSFDLQNGRKRWCLRRYLGVELSTPLVDQFDTTYLGQAAVMAAFAQNDSVKWTDPVLGTPIGSAFTPDGNLLVITHLGQVEVLDPVNGRVVSAPIELVPIANRADAAQGLNDCVAHGPSCPVSSPPAYDPASSRFVLSFWAPGAPGAGLVGMRYDPENKTLAVVWRSPPATEAGHGPVSQGPIGMPAIGAGMVYALDGSGALSAYNLTTGAKLWSTATGRSAASVLAVAPEGVVVLGSDGGGPNPAPLAAYSDKGQLYKRDDVLCLSPVTVAGPNTGFVLARPASGKGMTLLRFDIRTGATRSVTELPDLPTAASPGISVAPGGQLVFAVAGQLVALGPK